MSSFVYRMLTIDSQQIDDSLVVYVVSPSPCYAIVNSRGLFKNESKFIVCLIGIDIVIVYFIVCLLCVLVSFIPGIMKRTEAFV